MLFRDAVFNVEKKDWREKETDRFVANLLVPKFMLDEYYKIAFVQELSDLFIFSMLFRQNRIKFEYGE